MAKAERLIELMITMNAKRHFTLAELADEFSVSKRTILRDLQTLDRIGFPFYSEVGAGGGYHLLNERILPPITFTENEAKAMFFAYQSLAFYRDLPFTQESISALKKLLNYLPADIQHNITNMQKKVVFWVPDRYCQTPLLKEILHIIMAEQAMTICYQSKGGASTRTILPIGLYSMNGLWYCPAYCMKAKSIREFRADRMTQIIAIEEPPVIDITLPKTIREYLTTAQPSTSYLIKIELTAAGVRHCETEPLLAHGLKRLDSGGYIEMHISQSTFDWLVGYLLPLGKDATILKPLELKQQMQAKIEELHQHYCK